MSENEKMTASGYYLDEDGQLNFLENTEPEYHTDFANIVLKDNKMIRRMGTTTLLGEKIFTEALSQIKIVNPEDIKGTREEEFFKQAYRKTGTNYNEGLIAVLQNAQVRKALNNNNGSYYLQVEKLMNTPAFSQSWTIIYEDKDVIGQTSVITGTLYDKATGRLFIKFNSDLRDSLINLHDNYTRLDKEILYGFKSITAYSLYQLLKSALSYMEACQKKSGYPLKTEYAITYETAELKFLTGVYQLDTSPNASPKSVEAARLVKLRRFAEAEDILPNRSKSSKSFAEFKRNHLDKSFEAINGFPYKSSFEEDSSEYKALCATKHKTDIHFRYQGNYSGRGGKVNSVTFWIRWDKPEMLITESSDIDDHDELIDLIADRVKEITDANIKLSEMKKIGEAANWKKDLINSTFDIVKETAKIKQIDNFVGYVLGVIKGGAQKNVSVGSNSRVVSESARKYNNYMTSNYSNEDMANIERQLLEKTYGEE